MLALLIATSLSAFGQTGTITGRVVNESGEPLSNVRVTARAVGSQLQSEATTTDREGNFQINGLEPRNYQVYAWLSAYTSLTAELDDTSARSYRVGESVTLVLTKGGVITGTVTTQSGEPVVGVRVRASLTSSDRSYLPIAYNRYLPERTTDDRGVYRFYGLPPGKYVVWAGGSSGINSRLDAFDADVPTYSPSSNRDTADEISVRAGEEITNVDIRYRGEPGRIVSGSAKGAESGATAGYGLMLTAAGKGKGEWNMYGTQEPGSKGFVFRGVDDGEYDLTALSAARNGQEQWGIVSKRITVKGADVTGIELVPQPIAWVSGRVVLEESKATECAGKQRPLFTETLVSASPDESQLSNAHLLFRGLVGAPVNPDAQGNVTIKNLIPGRYYFVPQFAAKYWYLQSVTLTPAAKTGAVVDAARIWTTLKSGDRLSGLTITLAQGAGSLHGQLVLKEGETQPEGAFVYLVPAEREKAGDVLRYFTGAVSGDGKIVLNNIAPGRYWVLVKSESVMKLRSPDQAEFRAKLRQEAEAKNTPVEFKPCENVVGVQIPLKASGQ